MISPKEIGIRFYKIIRRTIVEFGNDNAVQLSASLSFYTLFAIAPIIIIVISLAGIFYGTDAVQGKIYGQINGLVGSGAAMQIEDIIKNIKTQDQGITGAIIGIVILIVGATGVFTEIQTSINYIWSVKAKPAKGWLKLIKNRLLSFSLIISLGFIMLISLVLSAALDLLSDRLRIYFADATVYIFHTIDYGIVFLVITGLFTMIFKVLPDATIRWRDGIIGACFTAFLFLIGKYLIGLYLGHSTISHTYGAAASIVIILLWVYYSSLILYFGACFTEVYTIYYGGGITPDETAVFIIKREAKEIEVDAMEL